MAEPSGVPGIHVREERIVGLVQARLGVQVGRLWEQTQRHQGPGPLTHSPSPSQSQHHRRGSSRNRPRMPHQRGWNPRRKWRRWCCPRPWRQKWHVTEEALVASEVVRRNGGIG